MVSSQPSPPDNILEDPDGSRSKTHFDRPKLIVMLLGTYCIYLEVEWPTLFCVMLWISFQKTKHFGTNRLELFGSSYDYDYSYLVTEARFILDGTFN